MSRLGTCATLAAGAILALSGCKSFSFEVASPEMRSVHSLYLIVDSREKLDHGSTEAIKNLARPERYDKYPFFVQFLPQEEEDGYTWRQVDLRGGKLEPKINGERISLKFPASFIELQKDDPLIALVVRFDDNSWKCATDPLVLKGASEYRITSTELVAQR